MALTARALLIMLVTASRCARVATVYSSGQHAGHRAPCGRRGRDGATRRWASSCGGASARGQARVQRKAYSVRSNRGDLGTVASRVHPSASAYERFDRPDEAGEPGGLSDVHTFATFSSRAYHNSFISPTHPGFILVSSSADDRPWCRAPGHQAVTGVPEPPGTQHVGQDAQTAPTTASCPAVDRCLRRL